jgi:hypothetical protein
LPRYRLHLFRSPGNLATALRSMHMELVKPDLPLGATVQRSITVAEAVEHPCQNSVGSADKSKA